jgi:hypothetical protein
MDPVAHHAHAHDSTPSQRTLGSLSPRLFVIGLILGIVGLAGAAGTATLGGGKYLYVAGSGYLAGYMFWLTISVSALFFTIIHHLVRAGWSTSVRRLLEAMAVNIITLAILVVPIVLLLGSIYHWTHPGDDHVLILKSGWLNSGFFIGRLGLYLAIWIGIALWLWRNSVKQDATGDRNITLHLQGRVGIAVILFALATNWGYFDLLMSLDPHWYSTAFGVYTFAGGNLAMFSFLVLACRFLQRRGILVHEITTEHYHDMGKWMFAWTFFWGYIAYSQYMLIWYGNIPEETAWFFRRGAFTHDMYSNAWSIVSLALLFGHLLIPFAGLLSRHIKRNTRTLQFWAVWALVFHWVDLSWVVMPETRIVQDMVEAGKPASEQIGPMIGQMATVGLSIVGIGGFWLAGLVKVLGARPIIPVSDPRLHESLTYHNV